jgi:hypothetical protein
MVRRVGGTGREVDEKRFGGRQRFCCDTQVPVMSAMKR